MNLKLPPINTALRTSLGIFLLIVSSLVSTIEGELWGQCQISYNSISPLCSGENTGQITASVSNGCNCPFSSGIYWRIIHPTLGVLQTSPLVFQNSYTFSNLPGLVGNAQYTIQISNNATVWTTGIGATICTQGSIGLPDEPLIVATSPSVTNILCNGQATGSISISAYGGNYGGFGNPCQGYNVTWTGPTPPPNGVNLNCPPEIVTSNYQMNNLLAGTYTIIVDDYNNCDDTIIVTITQPPPIDTVFSITNAICATGTGSINVGASGGTPGGVGYQVAWQIPGGANLIAPNGPEIQAPGFLNYTIPQTGPYPPLVPGTYAIIITDNNGCVNSSQHTINFSNPSPIISGNSQMCAGTTQQLSISNNQPPAAGNPWSSSNPGIVSVNASTGVVTAEAPGSAIITFTSSSGCTGTFTINVNATPTFTLSNPPTLCAGQSTTLTATSTPNSYNYVWNTAPTNQNGVSTSSVTVSPATTTTYTVTATNATTGCSSSQNLTVTVNPIVTPTFNALGPYCQNATPTTLPAISSNGIAGTWSPTTISTTTIGSQTYNFTPNALGAPGCAQTGSLTIQTTTLPTATISGTTTVCQNAAQPNITFTGATGASTTPPYTFTYTVTGNPTPQTITTTSNSSSITLPIPTGTAGIFTYTLTNVAIGNSCSNAANGSATITVTANQTPTFNQLGPFCSGDAITLPAVSTNSFSGTWAPAVNNIATSAAVTTLYTFTPTVGGCATTAQMSITVNPNTTPTFNALGPYCQNATPATLPATSNNGSIAGTWSPATISTTAAGNSSYTFTPTSTATPTCATGATMNISIAPLPTATISGTTTVCQSAA
ncbi:MAG: hypothetical protein ACKO4Y_07285, partial [Flavobacteriales bacterium]